MHIVIVNGHNKKKAEQAKRKAIQGLRLRRTLNKPVLVLLVRQYAASLYSNGDKTHSK